MAPRIFIGSLAFGRVVQELDRVAPNEGILVPLCALVPAHPERNPCAPLSLSGLGEILIAAAVLVPQDRQVNQGMRVSVLPETDTLVNAKVEALVRRFPRLRACAYLHSHPFARGRTWPSAGARCDYEGHMLPLLRRNSDAGLTTSMSFIACRTHDTSGWLIHCFALDADARIVDLGFAEVVGDDDPRMRAAFAPALKSRADAHAILRHWRDEARRRRLRASADELFDGWHRLKVELGRQRTLVALVPIDIPKEPPRYYLVDRSTGETRSVDSHGKSLPLVIDELAATPRASTSEPALAAARSTP